MGNNINLVKVETADEMLNEINKRIAPFNKKINIYKSRIRWVLLASQAIGKSKGYNLLMSEDVIAALDSTRKWNKV